MFDIDNIQYNPDTMQYTCCCQCNSSQDAEYICAKYLMVARTFDTVGELYSRGATAIIGATNVKAAQNIAYYINANFFMPPLNIYVFYGSSRKGLTDRWCIGFNHPNSSHLIEMLNIQHSLVIADKEPQGWVTAEGNSYSVILLPGVINPKPTQELNQRVIICLEAIQKVTFRKLNPITL